MQNWPIFANFELFSPSNSILLIFLIEWMFPKGSQILVHDFRHQKFEIWTFLGWVMAILVKKARYFAPLQSNLEILPIFFTKMAICQPKKVQISKFWCLKSCTNIWLSTGNINSIPKVKNIELEGKECSKLAKIGQFFAWKKLKLNFLKNFPGFYFKSFLCVFLYVSMNFSHWQNLCDTPDLVRSLHRHRVHK